MNALQALRTHATRSYEDGERSASSPSHRCRSAEVSSVAFYRRDGMLSVLDSRPTLSRRGASLEISDDVARDGPSSANLGDATRSAWKTRKQHFRILLLPCTVLGFANVQE